MVNDKEEEVIASFESLLNRAIVAREPRGDLPPNFLTTKFIIIIIIIIIKDNEQKLKNFKF